MNSACSNCGKAVSRIGVPVCIRSVFGEGFFSPTSLQVQLFILKSKTKKAIESIKATVRKGESLLLFCSPNFWIFVAQPISLRAIPCIAEGSISYGLAPHSLRCRHPK